MHTHKHRTYCHESDQMADTKFHPGTLAPTTVLLALFYSHLGSLPNEPPSSSSFSNQTTLPNPPQ